MKLQELGLLPGFALGLLGLSGLLLGCKDDDPCDPGQVEKFSQCYPAAAGAGGSSGGAAPDAGDMGDGGGAAGAAPSAGLNSDFGTACLDTTAFSDCGGTAPICADLTPLGQSKMCTQLYCNAGEANAGVCPSTFTCFAAPGYPSLCIKK
jgi:hypothetical protein